jgi:hypothetical protein
MNQREYRRLRKAAKHHADNHAFNGLRQAMYTQTHAWGLIRDAFQAGSKYEREAGAVPQSEGT